MKKVVLSVIAVLGIASAAWALTPNATPDLEHSHAVENNAHEGHHHEIASEYCKYQCSKCGNQVSEYNFPSPQYGGRCRETSSGNHIWQKVSCR